MVQRAIRGRSRCRILVTNANKAWQAAHDPLLRRSLEEVELVVPEWAMVWGGRVLGRSDLHHVGGITLMVRLLEESDRAGWGCYFLGARPQVVEALVHRLRRERPGIRVVGYHHGYVDSDIERRVLAELRRTRPEILFVAMGSPRQEYFISALSPDSGPLVSLGVGGSFDVLAGFRREAPGWARGHGLEWLYRLAQEPTRLWKRYLVTNTWFIWSVLRDRVRGGDAGERCN